MSQDTDEDFYPGLKGEYMASTLERACLCCPFQIGALYDCNKDKLLPGKPLWDIDPNSDGHSCRSQAINDPKFAVSIDDNFEWKCDQLGVVDSCTKLSLLSGWVDYQGAAKVLRDNKVSKTQARVILASKSMLKMEEFVPDQTKVDLSDALLKGASHVVVGVLYGINMFFIFDQKVCEGEDYDAVQSNLEEKVRALTKPQQSGEFTTGTKLVSIKYYGDLKLDEQPNTFEQVARLCHNSPKKLNVPMRVWLHPLGQLTHQNFVLKISEAITDSLQQLMKSLREFEVRSRDLSIRTACSYFTEVRETFGRMERLVKVHRDELQKGLFDSLSRVRNGKADETELCSIVEKNKDSPFNCQYLASWFDNKDKEVKTLDGYLKQFQQLECIQFAFTNFDEYMTDTEVENILCFDFNIVQQDNNILQKMEDYNNGRKVNQETANLRPWHKDHRMREQIRRFKIFVKSNLTKDDLKFVVTNGESGSISKVGVILLFVEGSPTEFEPPDKPGKPVLSGLSGNRFCLSWEAPKNGVECIESYTVSYRSDPADEWCNKKASKLSIVLPGLLPDTVYYVKIKAVTSAGSSPECISDIRTPPEGPGKPHASCVTHNSFILKWEKSQQSLSCIILYRSSNDPADKWWSHTVSPAESSAMLSNLSPMTTYYCKVTAEISDGLTLESDISEPIKTMLPVSQPGKPHASDITHNSLKLSWSKATVADGNSLLHYSIAYKSVDKSVEEWHTKETASAQEQVLVENLDYKTSYFFKVHAVTAMGSGPESDQSDLINMKLPISRPSKPCASKITHTSVELTWDLPDIEGAENVLSYTIFYQSDNLSTEWHTQQTPACQQEKSVVTNLKSKTVYHFKVRAETAAGLGPESDLSDSIETLLPPPDKFQVLSVSHNSINLSWQKPACGSDFIQSYTVSFRHKDDASGKWCPRNTNSTEEYFVLNNITSNMSYYLKVRAETATGPGAECKLGDPVLTILPPPEKLKFNEVTCHSVCLSWQKPECDEYVTYVVFYHSDGNQKWSSQTTDKGITSLNVFDLFPGRFYHFKVLAKTANGTFSNESSTIKVLLPPDQPGKPWATSVSSTSIELKWNKPKHGFDSVENYTVFYRPEKSDIWENFSTADGRESTTLTKLIPKTVYLFKIQAMTSMKPSPESQNSDPIETLLPSPSKPLASNITHNSLQINWEKPKCGAETVTSYTIFYCKLPGQWQNKIAHSTQEYFVCSNLVPKTKYRFKVRAETATGSSLESELSDIIETLLPSPGKPYASKKTHNSIKLCWEKPERGSESIVAYTVFSRLGNDPHSEWIPQTSNSTIQSLDFFNLIPGSQLVFKVRAETATDSSPESDTAIVTLPPGQPSTPQISSNSRDSVHISWTMPAEHGATSVQHYTVLYCSVADTAEKLQSCSTHGTEGFIKISNLLPGAVYSFKVRAEGAGGSSPESESVEVTLPPDQPGKPEAYVVFHDNIMLKWSPPTHGAQIVRNYVIYYRLQSSKSRNWQLHGSENANACIGGLNPTATYVFKVRAETEVGPSPESEISDPIVTLLPPPGKPYADPKNLSYEKFVVKWQKPKISANIKHYSLFSRSVDEPTDKWCILRMFDNKTSFTFNATPGKVYVFKVSAVTTDGILTAESELSDPIQTKIKPWGAQLIGKCKKITSTKTDECPAYQLPLSTTMNKKDIVKVVVGGLPSRRLFTQGIPHKVLMVVGATGAGKSTLINGMANYIMGVDWEDEYRFKLISEETAHDQTKSQTRCITAYTFFKEDCKGSSLPFTLTVIDTPGFGDTGGLERDKEIVKQVKELFSIPGKDGIDQLHGIGFVTQAPLARLTPTQRYVFDSILAVFGKNVADNIFLMVTFADGKQPPVIDAARAAGVPFQNYFKFNNSALFASNQTSDNEFDKIFWKMGKKSFEDFFSHFHKAETQSLQQSREVLQKREQLEVTIQGLQPQIRAGLAKIDELRQERQLLKDHEADIITHREFTYQVQVTKQRMIKLPTGRFTTNCLKCNFTCHDNCIYANDGDKFKCSAMSKQGEKKATCKVCPKKCSWKEHVNNPYKFEIYQEMETRTSDELKAKYDSAMSDKDQVETVMKKMMTELEDMDRAVLMKIEQARETLQRLEEIALRPSHLTEVDYIDILIESEQQEARPGWSQRVKALREVREQAKILTQIQSNPIQTPKTNPDEQKLWEKMWDGFKSMWT